MMDKKLSGRFGKVAETENSVVVGLVGALNPDSLEYKDIIDIASFYGVNTSPDKFGYHYITASGALKRGCKLPVNNYNGFLEIFK